MPSPSNAVSEPVFQAVKNTGRGEKVLFVDDEKTIRQIAEEFLGQAGYSYICFGNGMEALKWLRDGNTCDILVTDMTMPGMTGEELIEEVRKMHPALPAILCTGYNHEPAGQRDTSVSASAFLSKPFSFPDLLVQIRKLLDQRV